MRTILKYLLALYVGFAGLADLRAQNYELEIDSLMGIPDTVYDGQTITFEVIVSMNTPLFYQGDVFVELEYGGNFYPVDSSVVANSFLSPNSPNTIQALHRFSTENDLQIGDNVVVVWPRIGDGFTPPQTVINPLTITVTLAEPAGMKPLPGQRVFKPFIRPNPAISNIQFYLEGNTNVKQTVLYALTGKILARVGSDTQMDISHLSAGVYFVDVTTQEGTVYSDKLLITR
ncbi:MAG: Secretion system C-terminal sorting domain [Bacteroidota bacterium]